MPAPNGDPNPGGQGDEVSISRAELESLKAKSATMDALETEATNLGFSNYDEYRSFLEEQKLAELERASLQQQVGGDPSKNVEPGKSAPASKSPTTPTSVGLNAEQLESINRANRVSTTTFLKADWLEYQFRQNNVPAEEKSNSTRDELTKIIQGPRGQLVAQIALDPEFDGNLYAAADHLKNLPKNSKELQETAANRANALNRAAQTSNINTTTAALPSASAPKGGTPAQNLADLIAPNTVNPALFKAN